jgi:hypothetical protein
LDATAGGLGGRDAPAIATDTVIRRAFGRVRHPEEDDHADDHEEIMRGQCAAGDDVVGNDRKRHPAGGGVARAMWQR